jgi:glycosyltransferase involved in cell wall biosynthesis
MKAAQKIAYRIRHGGNIGKPQGIDFFIEALKELKDRTDLFFLVVGRGTEYYKIEDHIKSSGQKNVLLMEHMPTNEYKKLMRLCDVGLILLSDKFTIPNFPSRVTAYMEAGLPVLAATDANTDLRDMLTGSGCGLWSRSGDIGAFINNIDTLAQSKTLRDTMGIKGRKWLEENYTVSKSYEIIMRHFE